MQWEVRSSSPSIRRRKTTETWKTVATSRSSKIKMWRYPQRQHGKNGKATRLPFNQQITRSRASSWRDGSKEVTLCQTGLEEGISKAPWLRLRKFECQTWCETVRLTCLCRIAISGLPCKADTRAHRANRAWLWTCRSRRQKAGWQDLPQFRASVEWHVNSILLERFSVQLPPTRGPPTRSSVRMAQAARTTTGTAKAHYKRWIATPPSDPLDRLKTRDVILNSKNMLMRVWATLSVVLL